MALHAVARRPRPTPSSRHPASKSGRHVSTARSTRVVVVDDHDDLRAIFSEVLGLAGWSVRSFPSAELALHEIVQDPPDLVLTDINLGGLSGRALARSLRVDPRTEHVAIVAASGSVAPSAALLRAFDLFLVKPVELATLSETLLRVLEETSGEP